MRTELPGHESLVIVATVKTMTARRNTEDQASRKRGGALEEASFFPGRLLTAPEPKSSRNQGHPEDAMSETDIQTWMRVPQIHVHQGLQDVGLMSEQHLSNAEHTPVRAS